MNTVNLARTAAPASAPKAQPAKPVAPQPAPAPAPVAEVPASAPTGALLTLDQVMRILKTRKLVDATMAGARIDTGLAIVGRGNATKDAENPRIVYNTNAMRKNAMAEAASHVRNGQYHDSIGDTPAAQEAYRAALNVGVLTFSLPADWTQFAAGSLITATVDSFQIKSGPDAGQIGLGLTAVKLLPGITVKGDANAWDNIFAGGDETSVPAGAAANAVV